MPLRQVYPSLKQGPDLPPYFCARSWLRDLDYEKKARSCSCFVPPSFIKTTLLDGGPKIAPDRGRILDIIIPGLTAICVRVCLSIYISVNLSLYLFPSFVGLELTKDL